MRVHVILRECDTDQVKLTMLIGTCIQMYVSFGDCKKLRLLTYFVILIIVRAV